MGFFDKLKEKLEKTRSSLSDGLDRVFGDYSRVDDDFFEELEEILIMADVGMKATDSIISRMKERVKEERLKEPAMVRQALVDSLAEEIRPDNTAYDFVDRKAVVMMVGVNGTGKTTSIGKLAIEFTRQGKKVIMAAADTFRAGANEQLEVWSERACVEMVSAPDGSDPAAVIYEAVDIFKSRNADILLVDTAGRLHNKKNLMGELSKINRIIENKLPDAAREVFLVLDATTGQNAISQVREFRTICSPTGIILTKMDGSARGGIVIAISSEFNIPVKYIGIGEHPDDLVRFNPEEFVRALISE